MTSNIQVIHGDTYIHNGTDTGYLSIPFPENVQDGDLLVALVQTIGAPVQTPEEFWNLLGSWTSGIQFVTALSLRYDSREGMSSVVLHAPADFMQGQVFGLRNTSSNPDGPTLIDTSLSQTTVPNVTSQDWPNQEELPHRKVFFAAAYKDGFVYEAVTQVNSSETIAALVYNQSNTFGAGLGIGAERFTPPPSDPAPSVHAPWNPDEKLYGTITFLDGPVDPENPEEPGDCSKTVEINIKISVNSCGEVSICTE